MRSMTTQFISTLTFLLMTWLTLDAYGNPRKNLEEGDKTAKELKEKWEKKKIKATEHPFYEGIPNESKLLSTQLEGKSQQEAQQNSASQMVMKSVKTRSQFIIDPKNDPLLVDSQKTLNEHLKTIGGQGTQLVIKNGTIKEEALTCEEARIPYPQTCKSQVIVPIVKKTVKKEWTGQIHFWMNKEAIKHGVYLACGAIRNNRYKLYKSDGDITAAYKSCIQELANKKRRSGGCIELPSLNVPVDKIIEVKVEKRIPPQGKIWKVPKFQTVCEGLTYNNLEDRRSWYDCKHSIKIVYEEEVYDILPDEEEIYCDELEKKTALGLCSYESKTCSQDKQTRLIQGIPITRDCWGYTRTYNCEYPSKDDCGPLRARGCAQGKSACKTYVGKICVVHTQTYTCKANSQPNYQIKGGQTPFCLDGNCRDQSWENNDEMMGSLAQLSILKEMQGQFKNGTIFKGEDRRCSRWIVGFKDCCGSGKGWGKSIGLSKCSTGEKELSEKRKAGFCHSIGTYCAEKILGRCIKKKSTYCCFNNKLLKAFHVQGRKQINLGWGEPKEPLCRGFTVEELQRIDFSKLDLTEVFEDLMKKFQTGKNKSNATDMKKQIGNRMEVIKKGMLPSNKKQPNQRPEA